ncbi:MAG TPA: ATP-binding protein, partial [Pyrinomonadaceae bacterium]|nr:ATP-binding protein [Pyrinomonadaceae bacterium]
SGMVVLATTNHPDRLDPALLNRPSRFDRKYQFNLPAEAERVAYVAGWNKQLQPELRLSEPAVNEVAQMTADFSFAYLKELFVSATTQWMSARESEPDLKHACESSPPMDSIVVELAKQLRQQMKSASDAPSQPDNVVSKVCGMLGKVWKEVRSRMSRLTG